MDTVTVNGVEYVRKDQVSPAVSPDNIQAPGVIIRSRDSGVHFGWLTKKEGNEVVLNHARRVWSWSGAASLSQMAKEGVKNPESCKFSVPVHEITVMGVCEIIPCTKAAWDNISGVKEWRNE